MIVNVIRGWLGLPPSVLPREHKWGAWSVDEKQTQALRGVGIVNRQTCTVCGVTRCEVLQPGRINFPTEACKSDMPAMPVSHFIPACPTCGSADISGHGVPRGMFHWMCSECGYRWSQMDKDAP